ncbi:TRAP transporter substrate-binding protein [Ammoniphilus sp. YIM 78166]|uniref:TRAP transporter substrate-binding protein n=1 Tax=Ammoniphilus sp. YIM 78166 TaxID=1644106 RepID=UPI00106F67B3|nr:TRAP transporter substrate-binding protein [Ammoniphilus sp. YIM 78166]
MKKTRLTLGLVIVLILSMMVSGCGSNNAATSNNKPDAPADTAKPAETAVPDKVVEMDIGFSEAPGRGHHQMAMKFAELVAQKSNGSIKINIFPGSQLGGDVKMIQSVRSGTQSFTITNTGNIASFLKEFQIFDAPYLFDDLDQANKILSGPVGRKFLDMLENNGIVGLGWLSATERNVFSNKPINTADDLKGLKLRVLQAPGHIKSYEALSTQPTPMAYAEIYLSLQQGVIDGADTAPDQFLSEKFYEVTKYYNMTKVHYLPIFLTVSKIQFDKLNPNQQTAIKDAAKEALASNVVEYKNFYNAALEEIKKKGVTIVNTDMESMKKKSAAAVDAIVKGTPNGQQLLDDIMAAKK